MLTRLSRVLGRLTGTVLLACVSALPASGQQSIRVVDSDGRPMPAVRVDLIGRGELIATYATSAEGVAEVGPERWSEVTRVSVSHLGFQTLLVQVADLSPDRILVLQPEPVELESILVAAGELCPITDDPRARRLWSEVAARYAQDTGLRAWLARLSRYGGSVRQDDLARPPAEAPVTYLAGGGPDGPPETPRSINDQIAGSGYASRAGALGTSRGVAWSYVALDREDAHHFASPVFGQAHDFAVQSESPEQASLIFCGKRNSEGPTTNGVITLAPGSAFLGAEWRFQTDDPDEGAGGSVVFAAYQDGLDERPHLVSARGQFYWHDGTELPYPNLTRTFYREGVANAEWYLLPSAERRCTSGRSFFGDPPPANDPNGVRFAACFEETWPPSYVPRSRMTIGRRPP